MKKRNKVFTIALAALLGAPFVGCGKTETRPKELFWNDSTEERVFLADFEDYNHDLTIMRISRSFGTITRNTDKQYAHSGTGSAKIQPLGGTVLYSNPMTYFTLQSQRYGFDYGDFTKVDYISMWIYNADEKEQFVKVGLITDILSFESIKYTTGDSFKLPAGEWTEVNYYVDFNTMNIAGNISEYATTMIKGVYLEFNNAGSMDVKDAPVFYLDDVSIGYRDEAFTFADPIVLGENEICDFEKLYQKYVFTGDVSGADTAAAMPDLSVVKASDYGITATSGSYALRALLHPTSSKGRYPRIVLPEKVMQKTALTSIPAEEYADYSFCFDVYNNSDRLITFSLIFYSKGRQHRSTYPLNCPAGKWVTFKKTLKEIGSGVTQSSPETYVDGLRVSDPGVFEISWHEYDKEEGDKEFFFDNFRLVKA